MQTEVDIYDVPSLLSGKVVVSWAWRSLGHG
jgi:hypothetical protein